MSGIFWVISCALEVFLCWVWWRREISRAVSHNGLPDEEATKLLLILHIVTTHVVARVACKNFALCER